MKVSLLKISITISLLGILLLLILSNILEPKLQSIDSITIKNLNQKVKIQGQIIGIKNFEDFQLLKISDQTKTIDIINRQQINLTEKQNLTIIGTLNQHNGNLQIQAEKIIG